MTVQKKTRKRWRVAALALIILFGCLQLTSPRIPYPPVTGEITAPPEVKQVLVNACYDCHSNQGRLQWFDRVAPASWLVAGHIKAGRAALNFSTWDSLAPAARSAALYTAVNQVLLGAMPLANYTPLHPRARLSANDIAVLKTWVNGFAAPPKKDSGQRPATLAATLPPATVPDALNGIAYIKGWDQWQVISTTDRFDNGTLRVIYGNDIAVKAIQSRQIHPWPNGAIFAKAAWWALTDSLGRVRPGDFFQVEFMIKDKTKYAATEGWGWARWRGLQPKPYGKNALFATECTTCHAPLKNNDFVFTQPLALNAH
ncbi:MAG TPA: heme-binding domain-containing protein [Chitinophaga sp.]